ncbi:hypothetical protein FVE85_6016 [Porphyridium purpureum]|uniref:Uncharacterized protein n=1 Tax=Porphyridium purpureum TaxID=35688 RepID=A0A5J4Z3H6_PORPP|nr:hypothetical protein FVE85_6016 [Porphyridium purpureum]|eukprot:POR6841..scf295_1
MARMVVAFALALVAMVAMVKAQNELNAGVIYGVEVGANKDFFLINTTLPIIDGSITLIFGMNANRGTEFVDERCFGLIGTGGALNPSAPNALANDAVNRLFFVAWDDNLPTATQARLCYLSTANPMQPRVIYVQMLPDPVINGASFDQIGYIYTYIREVATPMTLVLSTLSRATGQVVQTRNVILFRDTTGGGAVGDLNVRFRGGDMAFNCERILYASSIRVQGSDKFFFSIDFNVGPAGIYDYALIHSDNVPAQTDEGLTGFATADQLAFDGAGDLISQDSRTGIFSFVNILTGANGELGAENTTNVVFRDPGTGAARRFADLASFLDCEVESGCVEGEGSTPCESAPFPIVIPSDGAGRECASFEGECRDPADCETVFPCIIWQFV